MSFSCNTNKRCHVLLYSSAVLHRSISNCFQFGFVVWFPSLSLEIIELNITSILRKNIVSQHQPPPQANSYYATEQRSLGTECESMSDVTSQLARDDGDEAELTSLLSKV